MFAAFSAIKIASEWSGSHNRPFHGSAASNAVKRHGLAEVTHKRIFTWPCGDTSELLLFSAVPHKHLSTSSLYNGQEFPICFVVRGDKYFPFFYAATCTFTARNNRVDETFPTVQ